MIPTPDQACAEDVSGGVTDYVRRQRGETGVQVRAPLRLRGSESSLPSPSQAAAVSIGAEPAPLYICVEVTSGGTRQRMHKPTTVGQTAAEHLRFLQNYIGDLPVKFRDWVGRIRANP